MKFVVLMLCVVTVPSYGIKYCEICPNHTLCKYTMSGPAAACQSFDKGSSLADADITEIVNRINARRTLVAAGRLKRFPQAANMRKMQWSDKLASFAQRWADQCDLSIRPNKEDECRDLVGVQVGQSIAAVVGPAPGLNVKSFIDIWFMQKLHYIGSVMYYNQSRDDRTNYFTQLIWADTEYVGCGKIKFFNPAINTVVERLICNFAPKGNNHGKPVYALGFPATQCPKFMTPDPDYPELCKQDHEAAMEIIPKSSTSSLLRILDPSNSPVKQDLDPNNLKQTNSNSSNYNDQRIQKIRHAFLSNSSGAIKRDSFHMQSSNLNPPSDIDNFKAHPYTPERGHSRMYHGHLAKIEQIPNFQTTPSFPEPDFRRFDVTTTLDPFNIQHNHEHSIDGRRIVNSQNGYFLGGRRIINNQNGYIPDGRKTISNHNDYAPDSRRNFGEQICTRKPKCDHCPPKPCDANQCTRGQSNSCDSCLNSQLCNSCLQPPLPPAPSHNSCPCKVTCPPIPSPVCPICPSPKCAPSEPISVCDKRRAQGDALEINKNTQYNYYDLLPNIELRSNAENRQKYYENTDTEDNMQYDNKQSKTANQVKEIPGNIQMNSQQTQNSNNIFYSSERKRRDFEDQMTFKPFWQMDEYKRPSELKSLRYTTLADKRNKKNRWTPSMKLPTESITIKLNYMPQDHFTEKYLSFEELMRLRKLSTQDDLDYKIRRFGDDSLRQKKPAATTKKGAATTKKGAATTKKGAATTKKGAATTKKGATTTKKGAATTKKVATTTKKAATTTKKPAVTTKPAAVTTKATAATTKAPATTTTTINTALAATTTATEDMDTEETFPSITANTPFIRMKQCTRKITCTWTALMFITASNGNLVTGITNDEGGIIYYTEIGSKTPAGYVDGCTRTSTCTRDFMDRNKSPVQSTDDDIHLTEDVHSTSEDEEYCERRSLNVQRRNLGDTEKKMNFELQEAMTEVAPPSSIINHVTNRDIVAKNKVTEYKSRDCICYDSYSRNKRDDNSVFKQLTQNSCYDRAENNNAKYENINDLYSMLRKMSFAPRGDNIPHSCACNDTNELNFPLHWINVLSYNSFTLIYYYISVKLNNY